MNYKNCLTGMLLLSLKVWSQEIKPLSVGDKMPAINIINILNYPALHSNLSAFNDRLVILDFMASNCSSCLKILPHFDSLQKSYGNKLQIILVTYEKKEKVKRFLQNHPDVKLPIAGEDTLLTKYFPHTFISHEVWIQDSVVKAITYPEYVTATNIATVLAKLKVDWPVKKDIADFDYSKPLLAANAETIPKENSTGMFYTTLVPYIKNVPPHFYKVTDSSKHITRTVMMNMGVIDLYLHCYNKSAYPIGHTLLKVADISKYVYPENSYRDVWYSKNTFCYEAMLPQDLATEVSMNKMLFDLDFYLGTNGSLEQMMVKGYVLQRVDTALRLVSKEASRLQACEDGSVSLSVKELLFFLNNSSYGIPAFDETGLKQKLYLNLSTQSMHNISLLQKEISHYGLRITTAMRETEMFVLQENTLITKK